MPYADYDATVAAEQAKLIRWLAGQVDNRQTAEDISQQTFLELWRNRAAVRLWTTTLVFATARHRLMDYLRMPNRQTVPLDDLYPDSSTALEMFELRADLAHIINQIPECYRSVMLLRAQGLDYSVIARTLNVPLGTVKRRLNYGRQVARDLRDGLAS